MTDFNEWNATSPGIIALTHTQYEIKHEKVGGTWYFNVYWRGDCVAPCHFSMASAKQRAMDHLNEMLQMGYEV